MPKVRTMLCAILQAAPIPFCRECCLPIGPVRYLVIMYLVGNMLWAVRSR
ncbi:unnamed protein product [Ectocarpus sp. 13 AM-2016]